MSIGKDLMGVSKSNLNLEPVVEKSRPITFHYTPEEDIELSDICRGLVVYEFNIESEKLYVDYNSRVSDMLGEQPVGLPPVSDGVYKVRLVDMDILFKFNLVEGVLNLDIFYKPSKTLSIDPRYMYSGVTYIRLGVVKLDYVTGSVETATLGYYSKCSYEGTTRFIKLVREPDYVSDFIISKQVQLKEDMKLRVMKFTRWFMELNTCISQCSMLSEGDISSTLAFTLNDNKTLSQFICDLGSIPRENIEQDGFVTPSVGVCGDKVSSEAIDVYDKVEVGAFQV